MCMFVGALSSGMGWWFSILLLCSIRDVRCCMEMVDICEGVM